MIKKSLAKSLPLVVMLAAVTVHAEGPAPAPAPTPTPAVTPTVVVEVKLTGPQMMERLATLQVQVDDDYQHVQHLETIARKEKDVLKLSCVNNKLLEMKAQLNIFDTNRTQFQSSLSASADAARGSFNDTTSSANRVKELRSEADTCAGVPELSKQSGNDFTHPSFPDDPTLPLPPTVYGGYGDPPGYASPFV